jgi:hypothetical protein
LYEGGGLQPTSYINIILENGHEIVHISLKKWTIYKPANRLQQINNDHSHATNCVEHLPPATIETDT